jgi:phage terminase large subunit
VNQLVPVTPIKFGRASLMVPGKFRGLYSPKPYKGFYGGRGSAKSHSFARALVTKASQRPIRWLCCREIQKSIRDSVKKLLDDVIASVDLVDEDGAPFFESLDTEIRGANGAWFGFAGLRTNPDTVKSMEGLDGAWIEEANRVSARSLELLLPTLRAKDAELWCSWNPEFATDPVDQLFRNLGLPPGDMLSVEVSWRDNPWFPEVLRRQLEWQRGRDPEKYLHVWEGGYRRNAEAAVFKNWRVEDVGDPPAGTRLYFGADWGYSVDPSVLVRSWMPNPKTLVIDYEAWEVGCEIDDLPALFGGTDQHVPERWRNKRKRPGVPGAVRWPIRADSARPDTISYVRRHGFNIVAAAKGQGSVEDGIEFLQSLDIVVNPRCTNVIDELKSFSWKVDKKTEEVLPVLEDKKNHTIDSVRYSHEGTRKGHSGTHAATGAH